MRSAYGKALLFGVLLGVTGLIVLGCGDDPIDGTDGAGPAGNRAPHIDPVDPQNVNEGESMEVVFTLSDPDGDVLYLEVRDLPADAAFSPVTGKLTYQPGYDVVSSAEGSLTLPDITVSVDDLYLADETTVSITVYHVNRAPFFLGADAGPITEIEADLDPATEERVRFQVVDPDGDELTLRLEDSPAYARLEEETLILAPTEGDNGSIDEFEIVVSDGTIEARLPVRAVVGNLEAEIPAPTGLIQSSEDEELEVGAVALEGLFTFSADPHSFEHDDLRLQVQITEVGELWEDGRTGIGSAVAVDTVPTVDMTLEGGYEYRWRARYLSDEFGPGPYASFGGNADSDPDLVVSIVPETELDKVPHNPSPVDVTFEFSSPNVSDFECKLDSQSYSDCSSPKTYFGLADGEHTFTVRGMTRDGTPDPTPAQYAWEVIGGLAVPDTTITGYDTDPSSCTADFEFVAVLPAGQSAGFFECCLEESGLGGSSCSEDSDYETCWPPKSYESVDGEFYFYVRAVNIVGERDSSPAMQPFSLDCD